MTPDERKNPKILNYSRRKRIAAGCGLQVQDVNRLIKQYEQTCDMMKDSYLDYGSYCIDTSTALDNITLIGLGVMQNAMRCHLHRRMLTILTTIYYRTIRCVVEILKN